MTMNSLTEKIGAAGISALLIAFIAALAGWGMNIFALITGVVNFAPDSNWVLLVLRTIGVFVFPLGGVLGYF